VLVLDHHLKKDDRKYPPNFNLLINPEAAATCEIIFDLLKEGDKEISNVTASYLLLGIYTDTGGFFHSNTTPKLLLKIKELLKKGVLFKNIIQNAFRGRSVRVLNFWGEKISHSIFHPKLKFIFSWLNQKELDEKKISTEEIGGLVNLLNMCEEASFSVFLSDTEQGKIKGSLRSSEKKGVNVNTVSRFLGGGGHRLAAGFEAPGKIVDKHKSIKIK
jgi:phosphoesterase RecJ-like protein